MPSMLSEIHRVVSGFGDFRGRVFVERVLMKFMTYGYSKYGPKFYLDRRDYTNQAAFKGRYGTELCDLIHDLPDNGVFIDIGANQGIFSLVAGDHLRHGRVLAFEPNPHVFSKLVENLKLNELGNVSAFGCGISEVDMITELNFMPSHTGRGNTSETASEQRAVSVDVVLLRAELFAPLIKKNAPVRSLCKVDVEGAELSVLKALQSSEILDSLDTLFVEICRDQLMDFGSDVESIYRFMEENGFKPRKGLSSVPLYDEVFCR